MTDSFNAAIPIGRLALAFIPVLIALFIFYRWSKNFKRASWSVVRMLAQLLLMGYLLAFLFGYANSYLMLFILTVMIFASSWIALGSTKTAGWNYFPRVLISIALGGLSTLLLITQVVLNVNPWYQPQIMIPMAGMIFSSSMNTISLALERLHAELKHNDFVTARGTAFNAALIPNVNSMMAVGLVSIPGMMTGQILAGVSPLIAVRYQIMVMCMIFGASTLSAACFLTLVTPKKD